MVDATMSDAAARTIAKCGGVDKTARLVGASRGWVRRWGYRIESSGLGGRIPDKAKRKLIAKLDEIPGLTIEDIHGLPPREDAPEVAAE